MKIVLASAILKMEENFTFPEYRNLNFCAKRFVQKLFVNLSTYSKSKKSLVWFIPLNLIKHFYIPTDLKYCYLSCTGKNRFRLVIVGKK